MGLPNGLGENPVTADELSEDFYLEHPELPDEIYDAFDELLEICDWGILLDEDEDLARELILKIEEATGKPFDRKILAALIKAGI